MFPPSILCFKIGLKWSCSVTRDKNTIGKTQSPCFRRNIYNLADMADKKKTLVRPTVGYYCCPNSPWCLVSSDRNAVDDSNDKFLELDENRNQQMMDKTVIQMASSTIRIVNYLGIGKGSMAPHGSHRNAFVDVVVELHTWLGVEWHLF